MIKKHAIKLMIFDWDGTLFNSVGQIVHSLLYAAKKYDQPLMAHDAKDVIGLGLPEVMQRLFPNVPELHDLILTTYAEHYVEHSLQDQWFDGVAQMLDDLKNKGILLAVATGKNRKGLDRVLRKTQSTDIFVVTRAASETASKPNPKMLQEILDVTGISVEHAVMIGDTAYDLDMAQRIGMASVGVTYGVHSSDILQKYDPIAIVDTIEQLNHTLNVGLTGAPMAGEDIDRL
ncbi:HAD-IIIA family hydrolase [Acinetobacter sp. B5B]|uniref:HAD family hydrolase n=1 Tax=Acinetobacter baretiae TaxID=2605383 RepID=UPI0018C2A9EA|nr:HAD-IIIA family hydrolase [Acinetobacter baretiae]MBF7682856.1 HAD-IIIA family hydrolase [Acinetobacter baretiae]